MLVPVLSARVLRWPSILGWSPGPFAKFVFKKKAAFRSSGAPALLRGFSALKLKGGVFHPEQEIAAIRALRDEFPGMPLRLDPNAAWSVPTSIEVGKALEGVLEYLEDPTPGIEGMAQVRRSVPMPLATNMCVV
jgi:L-alanine-DL-glutamate epimerase-like enolase superfamily enzyme